MTYISVLFKTVNQATQMSHYENILFRHSVDGIFKLISDDTRLSKEKF